MAPKDDNEIPKLKEELNSLVSKIEEDKKKVADTTLSAACDGIEGAPKPRLGTKRLLKGHINKVNAVHYSGDSRHAVSGSLDGKLIIWDTWTGNKTQVIPLRSSWVMSASFSPSGNFVACGGMDNICTIYDLNNRDSTGVAKIVREILGFEGFLSCTRFLSDEHLITGSADMKICKWDVQTGSKIHEYFGHSGDVVTMSVSPDAHTFITGSVDRSAKLWDVRKSGTAGCIQTFWGHTSDVNSVCFHPSGLAFGTGSDDKSSRLFDIRADQQIGMYKPPNPNSGFTSCGLSMSGRIIFCGSDDGNVHMWDTLKESHLGTLQGHENRITTLSVPENGIGLATGSWDNCVRVWG